MVAWEGDHRDPHHRVINQLVGQHVMVHGSSGLASTPIWTFRQLGGSCGQRQPSGSRNARRRGPSCSTRVPGPGRCRRAAPQRSRRRESRRGPARGLDHLDQAMARAIQPVVAERRPRRGRPTRGTPAAAEKLSSGEFITVVTGVRVSPVGAVRVRARARVINSEANRNEHARDRIRTSGAESPRIGRAQSEVRSCPSSSTGTRSTRARPQKTSASGMRVPGPGREPARPRAQRRADFRGCERPVTA